MFGYLDNRVTARDRFNPKSRPNPRASDTDDAPAGARAIPPFSGGGLHLILPGTDPPVVYVYIRKNGSSNFKRWLQDDAWASGRTDMSIDGLDRVYGVSRVDQLAGSKTLLVLRHPEARLASLFRNKLIVRSFADDFLGSVTEVTGQDPDDMTFRQLVDTYLVDTLSNREEGFRALDVHTHPQTWHLWPIEYNRVVLLENLATAARCLFGDVLADRYFTGSVNSSSDSLVADDVTDVPVKELRAAYLASGALPDMSGLFDPSLSAKVRKAYAGDIALIDHVFGHP